MSRYIFGKTEWPPQGAILRGLEDGGGNGDEELTHEKTKSERNGCPTRWEEVLFCWFTERPWGVGLYNAI
jgi:hypothetical protein